MVPPGVPWALLIHKVVDDLFLLRPDCPVAVCYRTSWPDQDKVVGTLKDIVQKVREKVHQNVFNFGWACSRP